MSTRSWSKRSTMSYSGAHWVARRLKQHQPLETLVDFFLHPGASLR